MVRSFDWRSCARKCLDDSIDRLFYSSSNAQVAIKSLHRDDTDPVILEKKKSVSPSKQGNNHIMN
jgi:hypothetical protein